MALKTAKMFKDFYIAIGSDNRNIIFSMLGAVDVKIKNDNFASQITVKNDSDIDFYAYRYITFDGEAVFEITDIIKNGKYNTLFVQYIGNITFDDNNENFCVDGVSANTLARLGLSLTDFIGIVGNNTETYIQPVRDTDITDTQEHSLLLAVKIRYSELPQNLLTRYLWNGTENTLTEAGNESLQNPKRVFTRANLANFKSVSDLTGDAFFNSSDNAVSVFLLAPTTNSVGITISAMADGYSGVMRETISSLITPENFVRALSVLINDLTLSVNLTFITNSTLTFIQNTKHDGGQKHDMRATVSQSGITVVFPDNFTVLNSEFVLGGALRPVKDGGTNVGAVLVAAKIRDSKNSVLGGILENFDFYRYKLPESEDFPVLMKMFGENVISLQECRNGEIILQRTADGVRVWVDINRNIYEDIFTSIQFAQNAYSNFEAYKYANIELVQEQQRATLEQQQEQRKRQLKAQSAYNGANAILNAGANLANGNIFGAITSAFSSGLSISRDITMNEMQTQNEKANLYLQQQQEFERAAETILPSSERSGNINFETMIKFVYANSYPRGEFFEILYIRMSEIARAQISRYAYENKIIDKITSGADIVAPAWAFNTNKLIAKIVKQKPIEPRKDLYLFTSQADFIQKAINANLTAGAAGNFAKRSDGLLGNLEGNTGGIISFDFNAPKTGNARVYAFFTLRPNEEPFAGQIRIDFNTQQIGQNAVRPALQQGQTLWESTAPVYLGSASTIAGQATHIRFTILQGLTGHGVNFDRIEVVYDNE